jgi:hypothetical protein
MRIPASLRKEAKQNITSKDPGPDGPALISPQLPARRAYSSERGVEFTLDSKWNDGMMESWESKTDDGLIINFDPYHLYKKRSHSAKRGSSVFQHSSIPSFHDICSHHSQFSLTWPSFRPVGRAYSPEGGPDFHC